jgi:hypothetical protein
MNKLSNVFGMSDLSMKVNREYTTAILTVFNFLKTGLLLTESDKLDLTESISVVKGMVNRCVKQDQWDWFTVYTHLGEPDPKNLAQIVNLLIDLRRAVLASETVKISSTCSHLVKLCFYDISLFFLESKHLTYSGDGGRVMLLSEKGTKNLIYLRTTRGDVFSLLCEVNRSGAAIGPRGVFHVKNMKLAEKVITEELSHHVLHLYDYSFKCGYSQLSKDIKALLTSKDLLL